MRDPLGRDLAKYIQDKIAEAKFDAVALNQIAEWGAIHFDIDGNTLDGFVHEVICGLLDAGTVVVRSVKPGLGYDWERHPDYSELEKNELVDKLILNWKKSPDGSGYFAWFTFNV